MANANLNAARWGAADEFYTQWADIEREMNAYLEFDPDVFRGKTILLPCDDPEWSNFSKFFALHFSDFGLAKLISTSFAPESNAGGAFYVPTLFDDPQFDDTMDVTHGKIFTLLPEDISGDGRVDIDDLQWTYLEGDGDFRSAEVTSLCDEADMVITNPPFSLFRVFVDWLLEGRVAFSVIGRNHAVTYKEVFPKIRDNFLWTGATGNSSDMVFGVPKGFPVKEADRLKAKRMGYPSDEKRDYTRLGNSCWFTNIEHGRRHEPLQLMSMADNVKYSRHQAVRGQEYQKFDNFDALAIPYVDSIPADYEGVMGVPVSYLDKHNPDQYQLVGMTAYGQVPPDLMLPFQEGHHRPYLNGDAIFQRVLIRKKG